MLGYATAPRLTARQDKSVVFILLMLAIVAFGLLAPIIGVATLVLSFWYPLGVAFLYGVATSVGVVGLWVLATLLAPEPPRL